MFEAFYMMTLKMKKTKYDILYLYSIRYLNERLSWKKEKEKINSPHSLHI